MQDSPLLTVADDWSFWNRPVPDTVPRDVELPAELRDDVALVVQGVRRCGKSTLLAQLMDRYDLDPADCLFVNFEDPRLSASLDHTTLQRLVEDFGPSRKAPATYFLDEIQLVEGWERWLRSQLDRRTGSRFVVTGSNANLLSGELGTSLTGRHLTVELFPLSLEEARRANPRSTLEDYLESGGFPAPLTSPDRDLMLRGYFLDIVERDVRERVGARSSLPLRQVVQMLFESAGSELSLRRIAAAVGIATDTVALYVEAVESAYLAFACPYFAWSERKRSVRNKKYYPIDTGLRRVSVTKTGRDLGKMLECATFITLRQRFERVSYWRGRGEVDFVVEQEGQAVPIQVTWEEPSERHRKALDSFYAEHPRAHDAVFVTPETYVAGLPELPGN